MRATPQSLVGRLVVAFLLPSLAILVSVAAITYFRATSALRESLFERLDAIATVKESAFEAWVGHLFEEHTLFVELPELVALATDSSSESQPPARRQAARERLRALLALIVEKRPSIREMFFLAPAGGRIVVSTEDGHEGQHRIYDRYYVEGKREPFIQNVYPSPVTLRPTLTLSAPVRGANGRLLGVLAAHLSLDYLDRNVLQSTGLGRTGVVTLVDRHKVLVSGERYGDRGVGGSATSAAVEDVILQRSGSGLYRDPGGADVIGVYHWLEHRDLGLIVEIQQQEAFAPARRLALSILTLGSLVPALLAGGIYLAARRIARPILAITEAADKVRDGDLSSRAPASTDDEIGDLAGTFNRMVEQLAADTEERRLAAEEREALIAELEAKNAELERFTYTVSHDLKSPLLTIKGFLGYLKRDVESGNTERVDSDLRRISDAAEKMVQLLDELLDLSRVGRVVHPPEEVRLDQLAREVAEAVARRDTNGAELVVQDLPAVLGDRVRLREVLENLVENAIKFMGDQSAPRVEVGSRQADGRTVFYVRDNGVGIPPRYHDTVFGLFDRLDPTIDGTGIGLAIVRRIVEVHGGRIWVESDGMNKGSTFCFTLSGETPVQKSSPINTGS